MLTHGYMDWNEAEHFVGKPLFIEDNWYLVREIDVKNHRLYLTSVNGNSYVFMFE